jgi:serine phosphatase RsbU (regulator of sigma subunit)
LKRLTPDPSEVLLRLNRDIVLAFGEMHLCFTACCFDLEIHQDGGFTVNYSNAAHPPLVLINNQVVNEVYLPGPILGVTHGELKLSKVKFSMQKGDRLFAFSDGLFEEWNTAGEKLDYSMLTQTLAFPEENLEKVFYKVVGQLELFVTGAAITDDITLIGVECLR